MNDAAPVPEPPVDRRGFRMPSKEARRARAKAGGAATAKRAKQYQAQVKAALKVVGLPGPEVVGSAVAASPWDMTPEQAEEALRRELSPEQLALCVARNLRQIMEEGGTAGANAAKQLLELQRELVPTSRKAVLVSFQPNGRENAG